MNDLRPPTVLWAPTFRKHLMAWLTRMDRRKALRLAREHQTALDVNWRRAYQEWWTEYGWAEGAMVPDEAFRNMLDIRHGKLPS